MNIMESIHKVQLNYSTNNHLVYLKLHYRLSYSLGHYQIQPFFELQHFLRRISVLCYSTFGIFKSYEILACNKVQGFSTNLLKISTRIKFN